MREECNTLFVRAGLPNCPPSAADVDVGGSAIDTNQVSDANAICGRGGGLRLLYRAVAVGPYKCVKSSAC